MKEIVPIKIRDAEPSISEAKRDWEATFDAVPDIIFLVDEFGVIQRANRALVNRLNTSFERIIRRARFAWGIGIQFADDTRAPSSGSNDGSFPKVLPAATEYLDRALDGWFSAQAHPLEVQPGRPRRAVIVLHDLTARMKAESEVRKSRELYRTVIDTQRELVCRSLLDTTLTFVNHAYARFFNRRPEELVGEKWIDFIPLPNRRAILDYLEGLKEDPSGHPYIHTVSAPSGETTWLEWVDEVVRDAEGNVVEVISVGRDVTERVRAEASLRRSEEEFRALVETIPDAICIVRGGRIQFANGRMAELTGYNVEELVSMSPVSMMVPEDGPRFLNVVAEFSTSKNAPERFELRVIRASGRLKVAWMRMRHLPPDQDGNERILLVLTDVTREYRAQEDLRRVQANLIDAQRLARLGSWVHDKESGTTEWSNELYRLLGISRRLPPSEELLFSRIVPEDRHRLEELRRQAQMGDGTFNCELRLRLDGREGNATFLYHEEAKVEGKSNLVRRGFLQDVTEVRELERQVELASRLESVGTLAGGIGHDFNNLLTGVTVGVSLARLHLEEGKYDRLQNEMDRIEGAANQARKLARQLLVFSKGNNPVLRNFPLQPVVEEAISFCTRGSAIHVEATWDLTTPDHPVFGDDGQVYQVIFNVLLNAREALANHSQPRLRVHAARIAVSRGSEWAHHVQAGEYVHLVVEDNGPGIPPEVLPRVFDPFYSTKGNSGLGLAVSQRILRNHGGTIAIDSPPAGGTRVSILLPAGRESAPLPASPVTPNGADLHGKILVMDDEPFMREALSTLLQTLGMEVTCAAEGEGALAEYEAAFEEGSPYRAVILDVTIRGGMGGDWAAEKILALDPAARVILASGYADSLDVASLPGRGIRSFLSKPFGLTQVRASLREAFA